MKILVVLASALVGTHMATAWSCNDPGAETVMDLFSLRNYPNAVCNDGSQAGYYYTPPPVLDSSSVWLIYLAGGGQCWDAKSCGDRWNGQAYPHHNCDASSASKPCFMSSKDYPSKCAKSGIFSTDTSKNLEVVAGAHKVYVPYCSSDAYMGDAVMWNVPLAGGRVGKLQFRGLNIVTAVLSDLVKNRGLSSRDMVIFGGGSAGGRGAMAWLDKARNMLPTDNVVGFLDSAYYMEAQPYPGSSFIGFPKVTELATENFNAQELRDYNYQCRVQHAAQEWKCLFGQHLAPYVSTPYFLVTSQYDSWQLSHLVHDYDGIEQGPKYTPDQVKYVEAFAADTKKALLDLTTTYTSFFGTQTNDKVTVFSPACYSHHESEKTLFWQRKDANGVSVDQAFAGFLNDAKKQYIDSCSTLNCQCTPAPVPLPTAAGGLGTYPTTTTTGIPQPPCAQATNQTACQSDTSCLWVRSKHACYQRYRGSGGGAGVAVLVTLLVIVLLVGIGAAVFLIIAKLRRKSHSGGGGDGFLVIGTPV